MEADLSFRRLVPDLESLEDLSLLRESFELECKLAGGRNGRGQLPDDFWPTYSAFANSRGGLILLGIRELSDGSFELAGIADPDRVRSDLFNALNNPQRVSSNLLHDSDVETREVGGKTVIIARVRAATRKEKPVFVGANPLVGTYRRLNDGDRRCDGETVRRMLAEQVEDTRDGRILSGFSIEDLDAESLRTYRQALRDARPEHIALEKDGVDFLRAIGGWKRERESGDSGLTLAGLLMFGTTDSIWEILPNYVVDYQEHQSSAPDQRWSDRITPDGTWSGNLYDLSPRLQKDYIGRQSAL